MAASWCRMLLRRCPPRTGPESPYRRSFPDSLGCAPIIIQGIFDLDAARWAAAAEVDGINVSSHRGRVRWTAGCPQSGRRTRAGADAHGKDS